MGKRIDLHNLLCSILGSNHVYFQPPESIKMEYPCIIYSRSSGYTDFADNVPYRSKIKYQIIIIDRDPDTNILEKILSLPMCLYDTHYTKDNLNYDVCNIYY